LSNNTLINEKLICAFRWSVLPSIKNLVCFYSNPFGLCGEEVLLGLVSIRLLQYSRVNFQVISDPCLSYQSEIYTGSNGCHRSTDT